LVIGYLCGANTGDEANEQSASLAHELAHRIRQRFSEEYGSVLCKDVREAADGKLSGCRRQSGKVDRRGAFGGICRHRMTFREATDRRRPAKRYSIPLTEEGKRAWQVV